jgi:hypothetical protein
MADRTNNTTTAATGAQGSKAVTTAGTPVPLVTSSTLVETVEIVAQRTRSTENTGNVYVGFASGADNQHRRLVPGEIWPISAPVGKKINLASIYIDAVTNGDGVVFSTLD